VNILNWFRMSKILKILCLLIYFSIKNANAYTDLYITSKYPTIYQTIYQSTCKLGNDIDFQSGCYLILLNGNKVSFDCEMQRFGAAKICYIPRIRGIYNMDKESINSLHCFKKVHAHGPLPYEYDLDNCTKSKEYYEMSIFNGFNGQNVSKLEIHANEYLKRESLDVVASSFPNLWKIKWRQRTTECFPLNQFLRNFKNLQKLSIFAKYSQLYTCSDLYPSNLTGIKNLRISLTKEASSNKQVTFSLNETLLRGMDNLERFELVCESPKYLHELPKQLLKGLTNLLSIKFRLCNISKFTEDHIQDLVSLTNLSFIGGSVDDFNWIRYVYMFINIYQYDTFTISVSVQI